MREMVDTLLSRREVETRHKGITGGSHMLVSMPPFIFFHSHHPHSLFCISRSHVLSLFYVLAFLFFVVFLIPPSAEPILILIPPYSPHLAKIKKYTYPQGDLNL
jgi:hypothetical protein